MISFEMKLLLFVSVMKCILAAQESSTVNLLALFFLFNGVPGNLIILFHVVVLVAQLTFYFCCAVFEIMIIHMHKSGRLYFITFTALKKKKYMCEQMVRSHD